MKKITILLALTLTIFSCKLTDQKEGDVSDEKSNSITKDSTVVNDKDENGCLASAGYIWSKVNKECIKGFTGMQLNPIDKPDNEDETLSAYVLFSEDAKQAEVFLPNESSSIVLTRDSKGKPWVFKDWQLIESKGYVLKNGNLDKFSGDGEIGKKVTDSDTEQ
jgi:hypothetical protein